MRFAISTGLALPLLGTLGSQAEAQTSCNGWHATYRARCGKANCRYCIEQMQACR